MMVEHGEEAGEDGMDGGFPMPALSSMQSGLGRTQPNQNGGASTTLMLRSLLTGANVPAVPGVSVVQGVVSRTSPVTLDPTVAAEPNPPEEDRPGRKLLF